jgi:hypothetical protein
MRSVSINYYKKHKRKIRRSLRKLAKKGIHFKVGKDFRSITYNKINVRVCDQIVDNFYMFALPFSHELDLIESIMTIRVEYLINSIFNDNDGPYTCLLVETADEKGAYEEDWECLSMMFSGYIMDKNIKKIYDRIYR